MMNEENPLMDDEQAGDAVAKYLEDNPELLQGIVPEHDLWPAIESRISARVIPMSVPAMRTARGPVRWVPILIAASALIAGSAGITYLITTRGAVPAASAPVANGDVIVDTNAGRQETTQAVRPPRSEAAVANNDVGKQAGAANDKAPVTAERQNAGAQLASHRVALSGDEMRQTYDSEITSLHATLESRRGQLNPATVAVIEQNLGVIDEAIRQSKAALARDPNSRLLNDQLDRTLAKKTGLLRAAALLPAA
jgi:hypothetical protein